MRACQYWELAVRAGEDVSTLSEHEFFGCWAGALGCLCIADEAALTELDRDDEAPAVITDALESDDMMATCLTLEDESEIALFATGGSGFFAAYWGWSAEGRLLELRGFTERRSGEEGSLVEYDFPPTTKEIPVVAFLGHRRWSLLGD